MSKLEHEKEIALLALGTLAESYCLGYPPLYSDIDKTIKYYLSQAYDQLKYEMEN